MNSIFAAGRTTTNEELEDMLEQGNPAVFTQVMVKLIIVCICLMFYFLGHHYGHSSCKANTS